MNGSERLVIENVHKTMGAVRALAGVSLSVPRGTVHGIIGHNGSGKSTLVKILAGVLPPDEGSYLIITGDEAQSREGRAPRVAAVFQDLGLADNLSVLDNLLANSFQRNKLGFISLAAERSRAREAMATVGLDLPLDLEARKLPEPEQVMLCVARAMMRAGVTRTLGTGLGGRRGARPDHARPGNARPGNASPGNASPDQPAASVDLLVMDEPTSSLPREELERFRDLVRRFRDETGVTTLIVTHNPTDIGAFCDGFTALKNGQVLCTQQASGVTSSMLAELMAGQSAIAPQVEEGDGTAREGATAAERARRAGTQVFVAESLMTPKLSGPVSLSVAEGELVGLTGLEGSGFREFIRAAMGVGEMTSGQVTIAGTPLRRGATGLGRADAVFIPSDRARTSGVPAATVYENMTLGRVDAYSRYGIINRKQERAAVAGMLERLRVFPADPRRVLSQMSGGQQQKVVIGRALLSNVRLLVFEEPTAAVDVGARETILRDLQNVARDGRTVIVASGEFEWMSAVCDRIVVFRSGGIAGELLPAAMKEEAILRLAYGD
jgi:ABC-type sugar transport system ATPase subunit